MDGKVAGHSRQLHVAYTLLNFSRDRIAGRNLFVELPSVFAESSGKTALEGSTINEWVTSALN